MNKLKIIISCLCFKLNACATNFNTIQLKLDKEIFIHDVLEKRNNITFKIKIKKTLLIRSKNLNISRVILSLQNEETQLASMSLETKEEKEYIICNLTLNRNLLRNSQIRINLTNSILSGVFRLSNVKTKIKN